MAAPPHFFECLEGRTLLASIPWGGAPKLIRQDAADAQFPTITGAGTAIAVIDTGIDYTHDFLGNGFGPGHKVVAGRDFVDNDDDPMDTYGHGTHVAGIIGASGFQVDGVQYRGIAPDANLIALRVDAANDPVPDSRIEKALQWVLDRQSTYNIVAANISFGSGHFEGNHTNATYGDELALMQKRGIFIVASSGNGGVSDPFGVEYPAADPAVWAAGAVDKFDVITEYTERGRNLDIVAPGEDIPTTGISPDGFDTVSGTSFAAPYIAGTVALMKQIDPNLKVGDERSILRAAGSHNLDGDSEFGTVTHLTFPRLDVLDSLKLATARKSGPLGASGNIALGGNGNEIHYDDNGVLHILYHDTVNGTLDYVTRSTDGHLSAPQTIGGGPDDTPGYASLAVDSFGRPAVAYHNGHAGDLNFARFDGDKWNIEIVDWRGSTGGYPALAFDKNDHPVISYYYKTRADLRVAQNDGSGWRLTAIDTGRDVGRATHIAYNPLNDEVAIAYERSTGSTLRVATGKAQGDTWNVTAVDPDIHGVAYMSVAWQPDNQPAVSYYNVPKADLVYAAFDGTTWQQQTLSRRGVVGQYSSLHFNDLGQADIVYFNRSRNQTLRIVGAIPTWTVTVLQSTGGHFLSSDYQPGTDTLTYAWFDTTDSTLKLATA